MTGPFLTIIEAFDLHEAPLKPLPDSVLYAEEYRLDAVKRADFVLNSYWICETYYERPKE